MERGTYRAQVVRTSTASREADWLVLAGPEKGKRVRGELTHGTLVTLGALDPRNHVKRPTQLYQAVEWCLGQVAMIDVEDDRVTLVHGVRTIGGEQIRTEAYERSPDEYGDVVLRDELGGRIIPPYRIYLKSKRWLVKRAAVLKRALSRCEGHDLNRHNQPVRCRRRAKEVHHTHYGNLGDEPLEDLVALCPTHHALVHGKEP